MTNTTKTIIINKLKVIESIYCKCSDMGLCAVHNRVQDIISIILMEKDE